MNIVGHLEEKTMFHKNRQCKVPSLLPWMQCLGNGVMKQRHILDLCLIACGSQVDFVLYFSIIFFLKCR